jgi:hypothetical protein
MTTDPIHALAMLGDALQDAANDDLAPRSRPPSVTRRRVARKLAIALAVVAVAVPATAFAASQLSGSAVAQSMPAGTLALAGTEPSCTIVSEGIEYHCTLNSAPVSEISDWTGVVGPTVDTSKHINGGCRSLVSDGREWECFLGQTAVERGVIRPGMLGYDAANPFTAEGVRKLTAVVSGAR